MSIRERQTYILESSLHYLNVLSEKTVPHSQWLAVYGENDGCVCQDVTKSDSTDRILGVKLPFSVNIAVEAVSFCF